MVMVVPSWRYGGAPNNASPSWSQTCGFWHGVGGRSNGLCPEKALIYPSIASTYLAISGGWLSGTVGATSGVACSTDTYVEIDGKGVRINIWLALADAVWSSSVSFTVYAHNVSGSFAGNIVVQPEFGTSLPASASKAVVFPLGSDCPSTSLATVVFYDDGTYAIS